MVENNIQDLELTHVLCPACHYLTSAYHARVIGDTFSGIVYGYILYCQHCKDISFLNYLGKPPLFDLSGRYAQIAKNISEEV